MKRLLIVSMFLAIATLAQSSFAGNGWKQTSSIYEVPVPNHLKDYAFFEIKDVRVRSKNGVEEIKYNLPLELTGAPNRIRLLSHSDGTVTGSKAEGQCSTETCSLQYRDLAFDETAIRELLVKQGHQGLELERRLEVSALFNGNPAGIIHRQRPTAQ